jgi:hypothetical protein
MTTHVESRATRYTFALAVTMVAALILGGLAVGSSMWPRAAAATASPGIDIAALMSNTDAAKLPTLEIADLF